MKRSESIRICDLRAADGGARYIVAVERSSANERVREEHTVLAARFEKPPEKRELDEAEYAILCREAEICDAIGMGMRMLGAGNNSRLRLWQKLRAKGVCAEAAEVAVREIVQRGFLDEIAGAVREAERGMEKYWGDRRILADIKAKGYPETACRAAAKRLAEEDPVARMLALLRRRRIAKPRDEKEAAKLFAALTRFGYNAGQIKDALEMW